VFSRKPELTYSEVAATLEDFLTGKGHEWAWDDYLTGTRFSDSYLIEVQEKMGNLPNECPSIVPNHYCSDEGFEIIRGYITELRNKVTVSH
jgi:hypothetical protein